MACVDPVPPKHPPHGVAQTPETAPPLPPPQSKPTVPGSAPDAGVAPPAEPQGGISTGTAPDPENPAGIPTGPLKPAVPGGEIGTGTAAPAEAPGGLLDLCIFLPEWSAVDDQVSNQVDLPESLHLETSVTSPEQLPLYGWHLNGAPTGIEVDETGLAVATVLAPPGVHQFTCGVFNNHGEAVSEIIEWEIIADASSPSWDEVPDGSILDTLLPVNIDMKTWAHGFELTGWSLNGNPAGITIDDIGVVTVADSVSTGSYPMSCSVSNNNGTTQSNGFTWEVAESYVPQPPVWHTPIPDQSDPVIDQPLTLDCKPYLTSLLPVTWDTNIGTINSNGILRLDGFPGGLIENISVSATNADGEAFSDFFDWDLLSATIFEDNFNRSNRNLANGDNGWFAVPGNDPMVIRSNQATLSSGIGFSYNETLVPPATNFRLYIDSLVNVSGEITQATVTFAVEPLTGEDAIVVLLEEGVMSVHLVDGGNSTQVATVPGSTAKSIMMEQTGSNLVVELGGVQAYAGNIGPPQGGGILIGGLSFQTPYPTFDNLLIEAI